MDDNNLTKIKVTEGIIKDVNISSEMKKSFLSYAMSVIVARALPDIRDGLKPVQRRIIFGMKELGVYSNSQYKKAARIVGDVMGKYHPHGDSSIYDAMVRMAQPFNQRYTLVDGHGNFGSIDGDPAAAMRYTEARMSKLAMEMIRDLDKDTVDFQDNYDASEQEPSLLPARYPNLLVNGSTGIAVGMATNIPPHNLGEVIDGILAYMDNRDIDVLELMEHIKGPDFPTGAQILGLTGLRNAYQTGNGKIVIRSKVEIINNKNKNSLIVTEIPYQVNKTRLIERIAEVAKDKIVEGITDLRDESNRKGMWIVIELRRDINPHVMLNNLYKHTQLQESYGINMIALVNNEPKTITLKDAIVNYVDFQMTVILRRTQFELDKAEKRLHILEGLVKVLNDIDNAIELIKTSSDADIAKERLIAKYAFSDEQAKAILDMRLQRLTGLEITKIKEEALEIRQRVIDLQSIISDDLKKEEIIKTELLEIKSRYSDERRSEINLSEDLDIEDEELIPVEDVIVTVTSNGYIKRMNVDQYKSQQRGGVGFAGIKMHEDDFVEHIHLTSTHDFQLFFTDKGRVFKIKGYKIPIGSRQSKGIPIINLLKLQDNERLASFTSIKDFDDINSHLFFVTKNGVVKKTDVSDYKNIRTNGIIALSLREDDELISVFLTDGKKEIIIGASNGKAIRFNENNVRSMGRTATGVRGMNLPSGEKVVGAAIVEDDQKEILVVTENGFGKRTNVNEYRLQTRGGKGVKTLNVTAKNGKLSVLKTVNNDEDLIVITDKGVVIRTAIAGISQTKRATQGVRIIKLKQDQKVSTVALIPHQEEDIEFTDDKPTFIQEEIEIINTKKADTAELDVLENDVEEVVIVKKSFFDEE